MRKRKQQQHAVPVRGTSHIITSVDCQQKSKKAAATRKAKYLQRAGE